MSWGVGAIVLPFRPSRKFILQGQSRQSQARLGGSHVLHQLIQSVKVVQLPIVGDVR
jgi:hypothetical protein